MAIADITSSRMTFAFQFASRLAAASRVSMRTRDDEQSEAVTRTIPVGFGTGAGQADQVFVDRRSLGPGAGELLGVSGPGVGLVTLENPHHEEVGATRMLGLAIVNTGATALRIGGDGAGDISSMWGADGDALVLRPGGFFVLCTGAGDATKYAVAAGEGLKVTNLDGAVAGGYDVVMFLNE